MKKKSNAGRPPKEKKIAFLANPFEQMLFDVQAERLASYGRPAKASHVIRDMLSRVDPPTPDSKHWKRWLRLIGEEETSSVWIVDEIPSIEGVCTIETLLIEQAEREIISALANGETIFKGIGMHLPINPGRIVIEAKPFSQTDICTIYIFSEAGGMNSVKKITIKNNTKKYSYIKELCQFVKD